ncbi:ScpA family protein [Ruicaihuangia caeni]
MAQPPSAAEHATTETDAATPGSATSSTDAAVRVVEADAPASVSPASVSAVEPDAVEQDAATSASGFRLTLNNFSGPFDLLLSLITKHELDITEVSLSKVTDEFIAYLKGLDTDEELNEASEFLVVAATLLDLKVAGLLPQGELVDAEDVALLEARDLLFARLLQYRAFKEAAQWFEQHFEAEGHRKYRSVRLEEKFRKQTPELKWTLSLDDFAALALLALTPREIPTVGLDHLHAPLVSIREQAATVVTLLRSAGALSFRELIAGVEQRGVVVARFIAVLELYRHASISFEQLEPLGELTIRWTAEHWSEEQLANLGADYDN